MTFTSGSLGPSQSSSCLKTSRPFLMALTSAVRARLGLLAGGAAEGEAGASREGTSWGASPSTACPRSSSPCCYSSSSARASLTGTNNTRR